MLASYFQSNKIVCFFLFSEGQCDATWDFFRGRCLQQLSSSYTYSGATSTCNGGHLLTVHYAQEITDVLSQYTCMYDISCVG